MSVSHNRLFKKNFFVPNWVYFLFRGFDHYRILEILDYFFPGVLFFMWMVVGNKNKRERKKEKKYARFAGTFSSRALRTARFARKFERS